MVNWFKAGSGTEEAAVPLYLKAALARGVEAFEAGDGSLLDLCVPLLNINAEVDRLILVLSDGSRLIRQPGGGSNGTWFRITPLFR